MPGNDPERYEVFFEYHEGAFAGVSIRERASGDEIAYLDAEELKDREESPGLLLERQG